MKNIFITFSLVICSCNLNAQQDQYDILKLQYDQLQMNSNFKGALSIAKQMNAFSLNTYGEKNPKYAISYRYMGNCFESLQMGDSAIFYWDKSLSTLSKQNCIDCLDAAHCYNNKGTYFANKGDLENAILYHLKSLEIRKKVFGNVHAEVAYSLNVLGNLYNSKKDFKTAETYIKSSVDMFKQTIGEENEEYAGSLTSLGLLYFNLKEYKLSEPNLKKSMEIYKRVLGLKHPDYASSLNNLAVLYAEILDFKSAEPYYIEAMEVYKKVYGENNSYFAASVFSLANFYWITGDYNSSEVYFKKSLELYRKLNGENDQFYAASLYYLASVNFKSSNFKIAEDYYKKALSIYGKISGENHPDYANCVMALGNIYFEMGNYKSAESYYKQAIEMHKKIYGPEHQIYAGSLSNLGALYYKLDDYKSAEPLYIEALQIKKKIVGNDHPDLAMFLTNLGLLYWSMQDFNSSLKYYQQSLEINKKYLGENHQNYASCLNNIGLLYQSAEDYKSAESYFKQALKIREKVLGEFHPDYATTISSLSVLYSEMGDFVSAEKYYRISLKNKLHNVSNNLTWLSSEEKEAFWKKEKSFGYYLNRFSAKAHEKVPACTELSYNANLISKSLILESSRELDRTITQLKDVQLKAQFSKMKELKSQYNKLTSEGSTDKSFLEKIKKQADSLDKILVVKLEPYSNAKRKFEITWKDIQSKLAENEAAIEFGVYYDKDIEYYMALIVRPGYQFPKLIKLTSGEKIKEANKNKDFSDLYTIIWKDIDKFLTGTSIVYYSPVGELNNVSFSALCIKSGDENLTKNESTNRGVVIGSNSTKNTTYSCSSELINKYQLHQLTTTRYLAEESIKKSSTMDLSLVLLGGIDFDNFPDKKGARDKVETSEDLKLQTNLTNEKKRSSSGFGQKMNYLPGTKEEISNIALTLNTSNWKVQTKSDKKAGEYEFKKELETKATGVLHIATHGFAFPDEAKQETKLLEMNQTSTYKVSEDPMVRCGLMLGGSNISWTGNPQKMIEQTGDDGILTAAEVANLDLSNTKLVVLSACETGLGKIEGSEGTFGLKRGFKLAGVEQMIVSLWSVPDKETMELMTLFYSDLTKTLNPVLSFEKAQKEMRNKYPTEPEKWAGFVLVR
ncbi:MAG: tetratricopeptide repeat protein [Bacteroidota bacterium]